MPTFDGPALSRADAELLRGILGPAIPAETSLRKAARDWRRRQRLAVMQRASVVVLLLGSFLWVSAALTTPESPSSMTISARTSPEPLATGSLRAAGSHSPGR